MIISVPGGDTQTNDFEEFSRHSGVHIRFRDYEGPATIRLPDFHDPLRRMVHQGLAHSFMPPPSREATVLATVEIDSERELAFLEHHFPLAQLRAGSGLPWHDGVVIVCLGRLIVYLAPEDLGSLSRVDIRQVAREASSADAELDSAMYPLGALLGVQYLHFAFCDGKPVFFGPGPAGAMASHH